MDSATTETPPRVPTNADDEPPPIRYVIYAIIWMKIDKPVYIGSTFRDYKREREHINIAGGAPRVAITFSQKRFQPRGKHFRFELLWRGVCSKAQVRAIEQHFMNFYETRVSPRPTNGITKDIDLMTGINGKDAGRLNVACACIDEGMIVWAAERVRRDRAIVVSNDKEKLLDQQCLDLLELDMDTAANLTPFATIGRIRDVYALFAPEAPVEITEVQARLNDVKDSMKSIEKGDAQELRDCFYFQMMWCHPDKRHKDTVSAAVVVSQFDMLMTALRPATWTCNYEEKTTTSNLITRPHLDTPEETLEMLVKMVSKKLVSASGEFIRPEDVVRCMQSIASPMEWDWVDGSKEPNDNTKLTKMAREAFEKENGLKWVKKAGGAKYDHKEKICGWHIRGWMLDGPRADHVENHKGGNAKHKQPTSDGGGSSKMAKFM